MSATEAREALRETEDFLRRLGHVDRDILVWIRGLLTEVETLRALAAPDDGREGPGLDSGAEERLRAALDTIREVCKPMSMTMQGPVWFDGGTPAGGGSRERIWRICDEVLSGGSVDEEARP